MIGDGPPEKDSQRGALWLVVLFAVALIVWLIATFYATQPSNAHDAPAMAAAPFDSPQQAF